MTSPEEFIEFIDEELGLQVTADQLEERFDRIAHWDSVKLLWLAMALERATGRPVRFADLLEASSLGEVYRLVAATAA